MGLTLSDAKSIVVFGRDSCPACVMAKEYLEEHDIPCESVTLDENVITIEDIQSKIKSHDIENYEVNTIPQIFAILSDNTELYIGGLQELTLIKVTK